MNLGRIKNEEKRKELANELMFIAVTSLFETEESLSACLVFPKHLLSQAPLMDMYKAAQPDTQTTFKPIQICIENRDKQWDEDEKARLGSKKGNKIGRQFCNIGAAKT